MGVVRESPLRRPAIARSSAISLLAGCVAAAAAGLSGCGNTANGAQPVTVPQVTGTGSPSGGSTTGPSGNGLPRILPGMAITIIPNHAPAGSGPIQVAVAGPMWPTPPIRVGWNSFFVGWQSGDASTSLHIARETTATLFYEIGPELLKTCGTAQVFVQLFDHIEGTTLGRSPSVTFTIDCPTAASAKASAHGAAATAATAVGTFTAIDSPGAISTVANDANNRGTVVGKYNDASGMHGFVLSQGGYATLDYPGADGTSCLGVNDNGAIVGRFVRGGVDYGFVYANGTFTEIDYPGSTATQGHGINLAGQIVGRYYSTDNPGTGGGNGRQHEHGYLLAQGAFTSLDFPASRTSDAWRITNDGVIVGDWSTNGSYGLGSLKSGAVHGYVLRNGQYTNVDFPGSRLTSVRGIDAQGQMAGIYWDQNFGEHAFVTNGGQFIGFDYPGATLTDASAITDSGQVVGLFVDATGVTHGFSATLSGP